jgi:hypothetical protein
MTFLGQLLDRAIGAIPEHLHDRVVVFGSAPMVFAGLKPDVTFDLDLLVDDVAYGALLDAGFHEDHDDRGLPRILVAEAVEVVSTWPGVTVDDVLERSAVQPGSRGLRVAALDDVLAFKSISAREKDQREAEMVRAHLLASQRA